MFMEGRSIALSICISVLREVRRMSTSELAELTGQSHRNVLRIMKELELTGRALRLSVEHLAEHNAWSEYHRRSGVAHLSNTRFVDTHTVWQLTDRRAA